MEKEVKNIGKHEKFEKVWRDEISKNLDSLESERKKAKKVSLSVFASIGVFMFVFVGLDMIWSVFDSVLIPTALVLMFAGMILWYLFKIFKNNKNTFSELYKEKVFDVILKFSEFDWEFLNYSKKTSQKDSIYIDGFRASDLYSRYEKVVADEVITAKYKNIDLVASEISATYRVQTKNGSREVTVFRGFFSEIKLNNAFEGETYVTTEADGSFFGGGHSVDVNKKKIKETELEWGEFERFLEIRTSDPVEAREIFAPDFMGVIYDWWIEHKKNIRFAFKGNSIFITIPSGINFEPVIFGSRKKEKEIIKEHLELLWFIEGLTKILVYHNRLDLK